MTDPRNIPPPPPGFVIEGQQGSIPPPPPGFVIEGGESQYQPTNVERGLDQIYAAQDKIAPGLSTVSRFAEGTYRGLQNFKTGVNQLINTSDIFADDEERAARSIRLKSDLARNDMRTMNLGPAGQLGSMAGEAAPSTMLPGGPGGSLVRRVVGGVATDVASSVADPVREDETRVGNLATAGAFSGVVRGGGGVLTSGFRRLANARSGNIPDAEIRALIDSADANDIRLFFQDVSDGAMSRKLGVMSENIFGAGNRMRQNEEARAAAGRYLSSLAGDPDDYAELVQTGIKRKLDIFQQRASRMYGDVANRIPGGQQVHTPTFDNALSVALADEMAKGTRANPQVIDFIERYRDAPRGTFDEMIEFRSEMLQEFRKMQNSVNTDRAVSYSARTSIGNAIESINDDMEMFARQFGADDLWKRANRFYYDNVVEFKSGKLKNLLNEDSASNFDQQAAWRYLTGQPNDERARRMWQSLDSTGRHAVRVGLIKEAIDAATPTTGPFSPAKFAAYLEKEMPNIDRFFRGERKDEIKGLINVMRHIERSGQYLENPPTGVRTIPLLIGGMAGYGAAVDPVTTAGALSGMGLMKALFETKTGRNMLLSASTTSPGSEDFEKIMQAIETFASRASN